MTFLQVVNEIFRRNAIIRGDTDTVSSFSDTAHNASIQIAILAVQDELADLVSDRIIPYERGSGSITLSTGYRTYNLAADFVRFYGVASLYNSSANRKVFEWTGGLKALQVEIWNYQTQTGAFNWWYYEPGTTKQIGVFQIPTSSENGQVWTYDYEKTTQVSSSSDTMPFHTDDEIRAFNSMAARRFKFMFEDTKNQADIQTVLNKDETYKNAKVRLMNLQRQTDFRPMYGTFYR